MKAQVNWFEAMDICERLGLQLAVPDTPEKDSDLLRIMGLSSFCVNEKV
jgi:hypothetical protein